MLQKPPVSAEKAQGYVCLHLSFQSPGETVQIEYGAGRGGCSAHCALCLPTILHSSLHLGTPVIHCRWAGHPVFVEYFDFWPRGLCCSASVSLLSFCGNQRLPLCTMQCSLPMLEPLKREVSLGLPHLGTIPCGLCLGSFQRLGLVFSPPRNVVLNLCCEGSKDWPMEIEPKPSYHWHWRKPTRETESVVITVQRGVDTGPGRALEPHIKETLGASLLEGVGLLGTQAEARTVKHQTELTCMESALAQFNMEDLEHLTLSES